MVLYRSVKAIFKACREHEGLHSDRRGYEDAIIMPFFSMLGYDVFNPQEFVPEFTADVGIKKVKKLTMQSSEMVSLSSSLSASPFLKIWIGTTLSSSAILVPPQQSLQFSPTVLSIASIRIWTAQTKWMMIPS